MEFSYLSNHTKPALAHRGMKVLGMSFSADTSLSLEIPHNLQGL